MSRGVGRGLNAVDASNSPGLAAIDVSRDNAKHFMVRTREQKKIDDDFPKRAAAHLVLDSRRTFLCKARVEWNSYIVRRTKA